MSTITANSVAAAGDERWRPGIAGISGDAAATSVANMSVVVTEVLPLGVTVGGENEQVLEVGSPEQAKLTCWLNPDDGVTVTVVVPEPPAVTVIVVGLILKEKLGAAAFTTWVSGVEVDPLKLASPP